MYNAVALKITASKSFSPGDFQAVYVQDSNFENDFSTKEFKNTSRNHKIVKYILSRIEIYRYANEIDPDSDLFTIEHILPENAKDTWGEFSFEAIHRSVYRLGNLTLLEKNLNREAGQLPYTEKTKLFQQSNSELTKAIPVHFHSWDEDKLAARQRELAKHAKAVWKIQELSY